MPFNSSSEFSDGGLRANDLELCGDGVAHEEENVIGDEDCLDLEIVDGDAHDRPVALRIAAFKTVMLSHGKCWLFPF